MLDTRYGVGSTVSPVPANGTVDLLLKGAVIPADTADAVVMNVTVTQPSSNGFVSIYPKAMGVATVSNLNYGPGQTVPNLASVLVNADDTVTFKNSSSGSAQLIADVAGYYLLGNPGASLAGYQRQTAKAMPRPSASAGVRP